MINCIMTWALCGIFPPGSITVCSVDINQSYAPCTLPISLPRVSIPQENLSAHGTVRNILAGNSVEAFGGLGYELGSSWSRGQSWALYSYVLSYIHTQKQEYLDAAKQVAHYFIANLAEYPVSLCDFRAPEIPIIYDSTAGACATYELIETAKNMPKYDQFLYLKATKGTEKRFLQLVHYRRILPKKRCGILSCYGY